MAKDQETVNGAGSVLHFAMIVAFFVVSLTPSQRRGVQGKWLHNCSSARSILQRSDQDAGMDESLTASCVAESGH